LYRGGFKILIIHGDCYEKLKLIEDKSVDLIIIDPPYNITQNHWDIKIDLDKMWIEIKRIRKDNAAVIIFGAEPFSSFVRLSNLKEYKYDLIWKKDRPTNYLNAKKQPLRDVEYIHVFGVDYIQVFYDKQCTYNPIKILGKPNNSIGSAEGQVCVNNNYGDHIRVHETTEEKYPRQVLEFAKPHPPVFPTQKPVKLLEYLIKTYSNPGDQVLDFFLGSGSTAVAAINLERKFTGIEKEKEHYDLAIDRIAKECSQRRLFI